MEIKLNIKHKWKRLNSIKKEIPEATRDGINNLLNNLRGQAIRLEKGHKSDGILVELIDFNTKTIKGRIYADASKFISNNESYLWYEYFGTGEFAELEHVGITKHFIESGFTEWYIPVKSVERSLNYPIKVINGKEFYVAKGAKSNKFLQNAEIYTREQNIKIIQNSIMKIFKEV